MKSFKKEYPNRTEWRNQLGQRHRVDGPAIEYPSGHKSWYLNGERHREDGPACEYVDGTKEWYYHGKYIDCKSQEEFERLLKLKAFW